jgi:universal stress protein A
MKAAKILVPIDFSEQSRFALQEADRIAVEQDAVLTLLHVHQIVQLAILEFTFVEPAPRIASIVEAAEKHLAEWAAGLSSKKAQIVVDTGQPLSVIIEHSERHDLIVISTHGRTGPSHFLLGSVAERVVQGAKCSVLVVKRKTETTAG